MLDKPTLDFKSINPAYQYIKADELSQAVTVVGWEILTDSDAFTLRSLRNHDVNAGHVFIIVVAVWAPIDLRVLELFSQRYIPSDDTKVCVLNIDTLTTKDAIKHYLPDAPAPPTTPYIAEYLHGTLSQVMYRDEARLWLASGGKHEE